MEQIKKYIRGNANRGHEVIAELEKLGGKNILQLKGDENDALYYISTGCHIFQDRIGEIKEESFAGQLLISHPDWEEIELPKHKYPKTYEECSVLLGCEDKIPLEIMGEFTRLINARNAYWKLYGEEMGLGRPWQPDWSNASNSVKYCIVFNNNIVSKRCYYTLYSKFSFPTEKMRDAFYDNFIELIKECKELL